MNVKFLLAECGQTSRNNPVGAKPTAATKIEGQIATSDLWFFGNYYRNEYGFFMPRASNEEKAATKLESKVLLLESKIDYCEERINEIVCQLYGLEGAEIDLINDNARR